MNMIPNKYLVRRWVGFDRFHCIFGDRMMLYFIFTATAIQYMYKKKYFQKHIFS